MTTVAQIVPNPADLFLLAPEEVAAVILEAIGAEFGKQVHRYNLLRAPSSLAGYPTGDQQKISNVLAEGWVWLEREGFLATRPDATERDWEFVTRRGAEFHDRTRIAQYRKASLLPKEVLHPLIYEKVYSAFLRGEYDTAVFQAFREVEVAVRKGGGFSDTDIGVKLMRDAFKVGGPLADSSAPPAEQEAMLALFAGAIGLFKNPTSHRHVSVKPEETVELLMFASHLLHMVQ